VVEGRVARECGRTVDVPDVRRILERESYAVKAPVDLYDSHYDRIDDDVYKSIRVETFGVDLGQESWITAEECDRFCDWLGIRAGHRVLEVACGSGGVASRIAEKRGASVVGTDINALAIKAARGRAAGNPPAGRVEFLTSDANGPLPFPDGSFDVVLCNDAINHFTDRSSVLGEWRRVLRVGGQCLFSDPVVVTGLVSNAEIAARSSIGYFMFSAPGVNESQLREAGLRVERTADLTDSVVQVSRKWREARDRHRSALLPIEAESKFDSIQKFLAAVHLLALERRLSRFVYVGRRTGNGDEPADAPADGATTAVARQSPPRGRVGG
jgi:SAM-dependent methyltransferase